MMPVFAVRRRAAAVMLVAALALAAARPASAQAEAPPRPDQAAGTIRGSVVDERTEQPLARVLVRLADTDYRATTGADGRFELRGVTPGDYTATVSVVGVSGRPRFLGSKGAEIGAAAVRRGRKPGAQGNNRVRTDMSSSNREGRIAASHNP